MEEFLVLYDRRGQCQRVAIAENEADLLAFESAGFVIVSHSEYDRCAGLAATAERDTLPTLVAAAGILVAANAATAPVAMLTVPANRTTLNNLQATLDTRLQTTTQRYLSGNISISQWNRQMTDIVNQGNIAARQVAVGGVRNLTRVDIRAIERANEVQAQFLNRFRRELEAGNLSDKQAIARARMYKGSTTPVFEDGRTAAMGLPPLPAQPAVRTSCHSNCLCHWDINPLDGLGNWDCWWVLARAEHCEQCLNREAAFSPLQIRNGIIQPFNAIGIYT